VNLKGFEPLTF